MNRDLARPAHARRTARTGRSRTRRRWAAHQARARNQSKEQAARLLNHAAKRVISNSAQASQLVLNLLDDLTCADEATRMRARDEAEDLLRTQWSSSVIGFHSCRQALLEKALIRSSSRTGLAASWARGGEQRDAFALGDLLASICRPPGDFEVRVDAPDVEVAAGVISKFYGAFDATPRRRGNAGCFPRRSPRTVYYWRLSSSTRFRTRGPTAMATRRSASAR